jgi:hypothetical protein
MNTATAAAFLAIIAQLYDAPSVPVDGKAQSAIEWLKPYAPHEAYVGGAVTGETLAYLGGVTWRTGKRWGVGAEYRQWSDTVTFARKSYKTTAHTAGGYLYRELPKIDKLTIRTEIGAGALLTDSDLDMGSTWVASVRASARLALADRIDLVLWTGGVRVGEMSVSDGRNSGKTRTSDFVDTGIAVSIKLGGKE